jgi:hypothetical protein
MNRLQALRTTLLVACVAGVSSTHAAQRPAMFQAATTFLDALTAEQRQAALIAFDSPERRHWSFDPPERVPRQGLPLDRMSEPQRTMAHALLKLGLSDRGYQAATSIMAGEVARGANPLNYYVSIFGQPSPDATWGWRFEGHDLSLNFTFLRGSLVASTPSFFGGPLNTEEDAARILLKALDDRQRARAMIAGDTPQDIVTMNTSVVSPLPAAGLPVTEMTDGQRELLMQLIQAYRTTMAFDVATARTARLRNAGLDRIVFSWAGSMEPGRPHYYRVLGPTFLIEYADPDGNATHAHSVWRDFDGDFGGTSAAVR